MPCYLFTYHAYLSWMPDRPEGFVRRGEGVLPPSEKDAAAYRRQATHDEVHFDEQKQRLVIDTVLEACTHIDCTPHYIVTELTHVHVLASWPGDVDWSKKRASIKKAITIAMSRTYGRRPWLSENASRKRVRDREHFEHLVQTYLPRHGGLKWSPQRGVEA